jgi:phage terminase small subunit
MAETAQTLKITAEHIDNELAKITLASLRHFICIDATGQPQINLSEASSEDLDALAEVTTEVVLEGRGDNRRRIRKTRIKLHSKLDALEKLTQRVGFYTQGSSDRSDPLTAIFEGIWARGSKAPLRGGVASETQALDL